MCICVCVCVCTHSLTKEFYFKGVPSLCFCSGLISLVSQACSSVPEEQIKDLKAIVFN